MSVFSRLRKWAGDSVAFVATAVLALVVLVTLGSMLWYFLTTVWHWYFDTNALTHGSYLPGNIAHWSSLLLFWALLAAVISRFHLGFAVICLLPHWLMALVYLGLADVRLSQLWDLTAFVLLWPLAGLGALLQHYRPELQEAVRQPEPQLAPALAPQLAPQLAQQTAPQAERSPAGSAAGQAAGSAAANPNHPYRPPRPPRNPHPATAHTSTSAPSPSADAEPEEEAPLMFVAQPARYTYADVQGMEATKARLLEAGSEIIGTTERLGEHRNGILLFGDPGNGKTFFVEALAGELGLPLLTVTFGEVSSQWVGGTTGQVVQAFRDAHAQAPCVLFLDEVDSLLRSRYDNLATTEEGPKTTNALLTELVNARRSPIVVMAATNYLDRLDSAAIREGRFDFKIEIGAPDEAARRALIRTDITRYPQLGIEEAALDRIARRWGGFSVARLRSVADEAVRTALKASAEPQVLNYADLQVALRTLQGRAGGLPENTPRLDQLIMPAELRRRLNGLAARMRHVERSESLGGSLPVGMLFWGAPGTGKSLTARALAKSVEWAFLASSGSQLLQNAEALDKLLREARDIRPAILFIDEADELLAPRSQAPHAAGTASRLYHAIDESQRQQHDLVWIAACADPEQLDAAALSGGRFATRIEFAVSDIDTLTHYVDHWLDQRKRKFKLDEELDNERIAAALEGHAVADVVAILQGAVDLMVERALQDGDNNPEGTLRPDDLQQAMRQFVGRQG